MAFNSFHFLLFISVVFLVWMVIKPSWRVHWITIAGLFFYGWFSVAFLPVLLLFIVVNYVTGLKVQSVANKGTWLFLAIAFNLLLLIFYKYIPFFSEVWQSTFNQTSLFSKWLMPIGISFFTIQGIGYNIDIYHEIDEAEKNPWMLTSYFVFFPKIAQGPVERPRNLLHQLKTPQLFNYENTVTGCNYIAWGLFKKMIVADRLALFLDPVYASPELYNGTTHWATSTLYVFQLYCDFSGYQDIATGISLFFGYRIMENFNRPFSATSVAEFWKRWHISFSTWLNEYLYNPLSVQLRHWAKPGIILCILVTFTISGLWHGTGWTFFAWGLLNGLVMAYEVLTTKWRKNLSKKFNPVVYKNFCHFLLLTFIVLSFVIGKSNSIPTGLSTLKKMFTDFSGGLNLILTGSDIYNYLIGIFALLFVIVVEKYKGNNGFRTLLKTKPTLMRWSFYILIVAVVVQWGVMGDNKFIYLQF